MAATFGEARPGRKWLKPRLDSGVYYLVRKPHVRSLGTKDPVEAERLYDEQVGLDPIEDGAIRCGKAFEAWIKDAKLVEGSRRNYQSAWRLYCQSFLKGKLVSEVTAKDIIRVLDAARAQGVGESRVTQVYVTLSSFFTSMTKEPTRYRYDNPVSKIGNKKPDDSVSGAVGVDEVLSKQEVDRLVACCVPRTNAFKEVLFAKQMALLIYVLAYGGMRIGEALALQLDDLRPAAPFGEWYIGKKVERFNRDGANPVSWFGPLKGKEGKIGDRVRHVPIMSAELRSRLDAYIAEGLEGGWLKPGGLLFPTTEGKARFVTGIDERFNKVRALAGLDGSARDRKSKATVIHHLRHTFASWLLESGEYDVAGIALLIGDTLKTCTDRYAHLANRDIHNARAVRAMAIRHGEVAPAPLAPEPAPAVAGNVIAVDFAARRAS